MERQKPYQASVHLMNRNSGQTFGTELRYIRALGLRDGGDERSFRGSDRQT